MEVPWFLLRFSSLETYLPVPICLCSLVKISSRGPADLKVCTFSIVSSAVLFSEVCANPRSQQPSRGEPSTLLLPQWPPRGDFFLSGYFWSCQEDIVMTLKASQDGKSTRVKNLILILINSSQSQLAIT